MLIQTSTSITCAEAIQNDEVGFNIKSISFEASASHDPIKDKLGSTIGMQVTDPKISCNLQGEINVKTGSSFDATYLVGGAIGLANATSNVGGIGTGSANTALTSAALWFVESVSKKLNAGKRIEGDVKLTLYPLFQPATDTTAVAAQ